MTRRVIESWVFDLDNTLYPADCNLFAEVDQRMARFIAERFQLDVSAARNLQKHYFRTHGTTLRGLMQEHGVDAREFLSFVHDIDFSLVAPSPALDRVLGRLPGRKFVFTNASADYAARVLSRLGVEDHFGGIFDIEMAGFLPKPEPASYRAMIDHFAIDPAGAVMVEDIARNLGPARDLGMATAWVPTGTSWSSDGVGDVEIDYIVEHLVEWLESMAAASRLDTSR